MKRRNIGIAAMLIVVLGNVANAGTIEYAWEGWITPLDVNADPWELGSSGKRFTIAALVDERADDRQTDEVSIATFELLNIELLIDGRPTGTGSVGDIIIFHELSLSDSVGVSLHEVSFNGVEEDFTSSARLSTSTFSFDGLSERPPKFLSALTTRGVGTQSETSSYGTGTSRGTAFTVKVIPEPSTFVLGLIGVLVVGVTRRRARVR